jgi:methanogenic corrinoid protein MtbC1
MDMTSDHSGAMLPKLRQDYLHLLLDGRRVEAMQAMIDVVDDGLPLETTYVDVIQPVMYEVGRLWQTDQIDIATEHYITAATQVLMARLFPQTLSRRRNMRRMVGCCLGSELHELGMRMVCDLFEFEGWDTYFLGATIPAKSLVRTISSHRPDLICLSATMAFGLPKIREVIRGLREAADGPPPRILVGGLPFLINPKLYVPVGADGTAPDAREAVRVAAALFNE